MIIFSPKALFSLVQHCFYPSNSTHNPSNTILTYQTILTTHFTILFTHPTRFHLIKQSTQPVLQSSFPIQHHFAPHYSPLISSNIFSTNITALFNCNYIYTIATFIFTPNIFNTKKEPTTFSRIPL